MMDDQIAGRIRLGAGDRGRPQILQVPIERNDDGSVTLVVDGSALVMLRKLCETNWSARRLCSADACPRCGTDWRITIANPSGTATEGSRLIGVVINDRVLYWDCPNCHARWARGAFVDTSPIYGGNSADGAPE